MKQKAEGRPREATWSPHVSSKDLEVAEAEGRSFIIPSGLLPNNLPEVDLQLQSDIFILFHCYKAASSPSQEVV